MNADRGMKPKLVGSEPLPIRSFNGLLGIAQLITGPQSMPGEELPGGEAAAAFALQLQKPQCLLPATHDDSGLVSFQDFSRITRELAVDFRGPNFKQSRFIGRGQQSE